MTGLRIFEKHPTADAYRIGGAFTPYAVVAKDKRFTDAELAAEFHAFVMTDHKYPDDPDEYGDAEWEAYSREWQQAERTILRFATLPHYDEQEAS